MGLDVARSLRESRCRTGRKVVLAEPDDVFAFTGPIVRGLDVREEMCGSSARTAGQTGGTKS